MFKDFVIVVLMFVIYLCALVITNNAFAGERVFTYTDNTRKEKHTLILEKDSDGSTFGVYFKKPIKPYRKRPIKSPFWKVIEKQNA